MVEEQSLSGGFGVSWRVPRHIHVYWSFGVGDHQNTSLAFVYKSDHSIQDLYMMMKVDLQVISHRARGNKIVFVPDSRGGNADVAGSGSGSGIYIIHEFKVVDGINRNVWNRKKGVYKMSMQDVTAMLHIVVNKTNPIYHIISINSIQYEFFYILYLKYIFLG